MSGESAESGFYSQDSEEFVKVSDDEESTVKTKEPKTSTRFLLKEIKHREWFCGLLDRKGAEMLLKKKPSGTWLVRHSQKPPVEDKDGYLRDRNRVVVSVVRHKDKNIKHIEMFAEAVAEKGTEVYKVHLTKKPIEKFDDVMQLLEYYSHTALSAISKDFNKDDFLQCPLEENAASRPKWKTIPAEETNQTPSDRDTHGDTAMGRDAHPHRHRRAKKLQHTSDLGTSGGTVQLDNSDVQLVVPPGSIPQDTTYTINTEIHVTNLDDFRSELTMATADERFISTVPEYVISQVRKKGRPAARPAGNNVFLKYVTIRIAHCVVEKERLQDIKVYCSDPERNVVGQPLTRINHFTDQQAAPLDASGRPLDAFFTADAQFVWVHTTHFTRYICTCGGETDLHMETLLFAGFKNYTAFQEVYLSVYLCEALFRLREFKQTLIEDEAAFWDPRYLVQSTAIKLPREGVRHTDQFHVEVDPDPDLRAWDHTTTSPFETTKFLDVGDVLECYHVVQGGIPPPKPKDVKFQLRNRGQRTEMFSGHLNVNVTGNLNPTLDMVSLNRLPFTIDVRDAASRRSAGGMSLESASASALSRSPGSSSLE